MEDNQCFALKGGKCTALNICVCYGKCSFYKTEEEHERGRLAAFARIARLPYGEQYIIAEEYYSGAYPWHSAEKALRRRFA